MLIGKAFVKGRGIILGVMEPNFLMGSMGAVVGEKFCAAVDKALDESLPLVAVICSGGARMHEGVVSLSQMAKTSAALARFDQTKGLFISILTDPTTGGVTASFAMLGDVIIAEPGAVIGFAGAAHHRRDDQGGTARRLPDLRIHAGARLRGHDRPPQGPPQRDRPHHRLLPEIAHSYYFRSSGVSPVCLAIRDNMRGPISS